MAVPEKVDAESMKDMVDWKGLFEKISETRGVKMPEIVSEFYDSKWINEQVKKYKFDDTDRVKQLIDFIKTQSEATKERLEGV